MSFRDIFPIRFKLLRTTYQLTGKAMAQMLKLKSASIITYWEKGINIPSLDVLADISLLFGVSTDWLLGYSNNPYTEEVVSSAEKMLFSKKAYSYDSLETIVSIHSLKWIPAEYFDEEKRVENYSLPVRANIVFLVTYYLSVYLSLMSEYEKIANSHPLVVKLMEYKKILAYMNNPESKEKELKQKLFYVNSLTQLLLNKKSATPIFDIQAQKTTEE